MRNQSKPKDFLRNKILPFPTHFTNNFVEGVAAISSATGGFDAAYSAISFLRALNSRSYGRHFVIECSLVAHFQLSCEEGNARARYRHSLKHKAEPRFEIRQQVELATGFKEMVFPVSMRGK